MKKFMIITAWIIGIAAAGVLLGFVSAERGRSVIKDVQVKIDHRNGSAMITPAEISSLVTAAGAVKGVPLDNIDMSRIEKLVRSRPEVLEAEVYCDLKGHLKIDVTQRVPLVRIYTESGDSYYLDNEGHFMPLSEHYTARVPVATGKIRMTYPVGSSLGSISKIEADPALRKKSVIDDVYHLAGFLQKDEFWLAQSEQINVNEQGELELIPRLGDHVILVGDAGQLDEKFSRLMALYRSGLPVKGWDRYSRISLKYNNQVVCTKK